MIDDKKLQQFLGKMLIDLGAAISVPLVRIGVRLGLYKAMPGAGPMTSAEFADKANISERYAREWLAQNAASGYLTYDPASRRFELPPEQAMVLAKEESPFFIGGGFDAVAALHQTQFLVEDAFKSGGGIDWGDHAGCLFCAIGAMRQISCITGCRHWMASWPSWNGVPRSPTLAAAPATRPSSWPEHSPTR